MTKKVTPATPDPYISKLLTDIVVGKTVLNLPKGSRIFKQGEPADAIYFIQSGKVGMNVLSIRGKKAALATMGPRNFVGEGCLVGHSLRVGTATALEACVVFRIERSAMLQALRQHADLAETFTSLLLTRHISLEEELCAHLFSHSEKRLARVLLKLARMHKREATPVAEIPKLSNAALAEMVGASPARVARYLKKFQELGLVDAKGKLSIRPELLIDVVLSD
jgi:CRP/FNR family transcriptional regulator, cyclic AMP receptor protein